MELEFVRYEKRDRIARVTINRPDVMNALHPPASDELSRVWDDFAADPDVWVAIFTGAGERAFSAGNDLKFQAAGGAVRMPPTGFGGITARRDLWKPVIAAVNGVALGGGLELALACDIRIASEDAQLGLTEVNLAIIPGGGGTQRLPRLVGRGKALEMILTGARLGAAEALRIGLVERVVPATEVLAAATTLARTMASKAPVALRYAKEAVVQGLQLPLADGLRLENDLATLLRTTEDRIEGARAFLEKRPPKWTGR